MHNAIMQECQAHIYQSLEADNNNNTLSKVYWYDNNKLWHSVKGYISGCSFPSQWRLASAAARFLLWDDAVQVAVLLCPSCSICVAHTCRCGATVDVQGQHGLICKQAPSRIVRHNVMNDIIFGSYPQLAFRPLRSLPAWPDWVASVLMAWL